MAAILTLTMNPALDVSTGTDRIQPTEKLRCDPPQHHPGGGGINVARVVTRLGGTACAVYPRGGPAGDMLDQLLAQEGVDGRAVSIAGMTRESFTVDEWGTGEQFRFVMPGPTLGRSECERILDGLGGLHGPGAFLVVSGSLPPGVPTDFYARVVVRARSDGYRVVLDSSGPAYREAVEEGPWLIKPNREEFEKLTGRPARSDGALVEQAQAIAASGRAHAILLSLGADGALMATASGYRFIRPPAVQVISAVGAGDSLVGALVLGLDRGWPLMRAACFGVAAGTAALATPGTELCRRADVERLFSTMCDVDEEEP